MCEINEAKTIEQLENKYLNKFYHLLKYAEDEILQGFETKEKIKSDWKDYWDIANKGDFSVGAERIIYSLINGKCTGQPNSCPVGSDLFFEVDDAFIHIDLKTVCASCTVVDKKGKLTGGNIGDFNTSIFVGMNQNSYSATYTPKGSAEKRQYKGFLPVEYTMKENDLNKKKYCLTYFISVLYEFENEEFNTLCINISCMPNGKLNFIYKDNPIRAGKNPDKARFNFYKCYKFTQLENQPKRMKIIYINSAKIEAQEIYKKKLKFLLDLSKENV